MGRNRKQPPPSSPPSSWHALRFGLNPSLKQKLTECLEYFDQPKLQELREQVRKFQEGENGQKLREVLERQRREEEEAARPAPPAKPKRGGGAPRKLKPAQIEAGISLLKSKPWTTVKEARALLRKELKLPGGDTMLFDAIIRKLGPS